MKKVFLPGFVLGVILGAIAGLLSGSWIFWLGAGLVIGLFVGASHGRRAARRMLVSSEEAKS